MEILEKFLMPIGEKVAKNKFLTILKESFMAIMPMTIIGSIAMIIKNFPFISNVVPDSIMAQVSAFLGNISTVTINLLAIYLVAAIGYYYAKRENNPTLYGIFIALAAFLIVTPLSLSIEGLENPITMGIIPTAYLGGNGLFSAVVVGMLSGYIYNKVLNSNFVIKLPNSVPPNVMEPFKVIIPALVTCIVFAGIRYAFNFTSWGSIHEFFFTVLQTPLMSLGTTLPASIIVVIVIQLLWFIGLHGQNIVMAVMTPIWQAATVANLNAITNGQNPEYIFTYQFFTAFIWIQFISLIIACIIGAKSNQLKAIGKVSAGAGAFCISEPIVFGTPVVLNFYLFIPWILVMVIFVIITWASMSLGLCPLPNGTAIPFTCPPLISGWLVTGSFMGAVVQALCIIVGTIVYLPFVKMYDKQLLAEEKANEKEKIGEV